MQWDLISSEDIPELISRMLISNLEEDKAHEYTLNPKTPIKDLSWKRLRSLVKLEATQFRACITYIIPD